VERIWGNPARIYFQIGVKSCERSESLQGGIEERSDEEVWNFTNEVRLSLKGERFVLF